MPDQPTSSAPRVESSTYIGRRTQCSSCCQLAPVVSESLGVLLYECELCGTRGAIEPSDLVPVSETGPT